MECNAAADDDDTALLLEVIVASRGGDVGGNRSDIAAVSVFSDVEAAVAMPAFPVVQ